MFYATKKMTHAEGGGGGLRSQGQARRHNLVNDDVIKSVWGKNQKLRPRLKFVDRQIYKQTSRPTDQQTVKTINKNNKTKQAGVKTISQRD